MTAPPTIAAIVLAAGASRRFGTDNKLLVEIDGQPLVARVIAAIESGGVSHIIVVTGHQPDHVAAAVASRGRRITYNERHAIGMGTSIACGIKALDDDVDGVLIVQGDMPALDASLIAALCRHFIDSGSNRIICPVLTDGRQGNPVLWPRRLFPDLRKLAGDHGAKHVIEAEGSAVVRVATTGNGAGIDIDTPEQLRAFVTQIKA